MDNFDIIYGLLVAPAANVFTIFGNPGADGDIDTWILGVRKTYRMHAKVLHPDVNPKRKAKADEAFGRLTKFYDAAQRYAKTGTLETKSEAASVGFPVVFKSRRYEYILEEKLCIGGTAGIFRGTCDGRKLGDRRNIIFKIAHRETDADLMHRESKFLTRIRDYHKTLSDEMAFVSRLVPNYHESFIILDGGVKKTANVFFCDEEFPTGWYTAEEIHQAYPRGISTRIAAFIFNRGLQALGSAHKCGWIHGGVTPQHLLVHPESHLGMIVDWTNATELGSPEGIAYADKKRWSVMLPPEILSPAGRAGTAADVYMLAATIVYLLGGKFESKNISLPPTVEASIVEFLNRCLQPMVRARPRDALTAFNELHGVLSKVFGKRKFVEFVMPEKTK